MSSFYNAASSKGKRVDQNFTQLTLTGGRPADPHFPAITPDLKVYGGGRFGKASFFDNNVQINGATLINNGETVNGGATINDGATVNGGLSVANGATIGGGATVNGGMKVNGKLTVTGIIDPPPALILEVSNVVPSIVELNQGMIWINWYDELIYVTDDNISHNILYTDTMGNTQTLSCLDTLIVGNVITDSLTVNSNITCSVYKTGFSLLTGNVVTYYSSSNEFQDCLYFDLVQGQYTVPETARYGINIDIDYKTNGSVTTNMASTINPSFALKRISPTTDDLIVRNLPFLDVDVPSVLTLRSVLGTGSIKMVAVLNLDQGDILELEYRDDSLNVQLDIGSGSANNNGLIWSIYKVY